MDKAFTVYTTLIMFLFGIVVTVSMLTGCESTQERSVRYGAFCKMNCEFQGAAAYAYNLGNERDCICTFRLRAR
jgi:hypothetical protein